MKGKWKKNDNAESNRSDKTYSLHALTDEGEDDDDGWVAVTRTRVGKGPGQRGKQESVQANDALAEGNKELENTFVAADEVNILEEKLASGRRRMTHKEKFTSAREEDEWKTTRKESKKKERQQPGHKQQEAEARKRNVAAKTPQPPPPGSLLERITQPCSPPSPFEPFMLILVGLPGSGKSTFARALERAMPWKFVRVNQDFLKTRLKCEALCYATMQEGRCPIIDRCNFDASQRGYFLTLAREFSWPVDCVVFTASPSECIQRCRARQGHETITPDKAAMVVNAMAQSWQPPRANDRRKSRPLFRSVTQVETFAEADALAQEWISTQMAAAAVATTTTPKENETKLKPVEENKVGTCSAEMDANVESCDRKGQKRSDE